jgi:hypothetical protein
MTDKVYYVLIIPAEAGDPDHLPTVLIGHLKMELIFVSLSLRQPKLQRRLALTLTLFLPAFVKTSEGAVPRSDESCNHKVIFC